MLLDVLRQKFFLGQSRDRCPGCLQLKQSPWSSLKRRFTQVQLTATSGFRVGVKVFRRGPSA